jgi:hypothetical protein
MIHRIEGDALLARLEGRASEMKVYTSTKTEDPAGAEGRGRRRFRRSNEDRDNQTKRVGRERGRERASAGRRETKVIRERLIEGVEESLVRALAPSRSRRGRKSISSLEASQGRFFIPSRSGLQYGRCWSTTIRSKRDRESERGKERGRCRGEELGVLDDLRGP